MMLSPTASPRSSSVPSQDDYHHQQARAFHESFDEAPLAPLAFLPRPNQRVFTIDRIGQSGDSAFGDTGNDGEKEKKIGFNHVGPECAVDVAPAQKSSPAVVTELSAKDVIIGGKGRASGPESYLQIIRQSVEEFEATNKMGNNNVPPVQPVVEELWITDHRFLLESKEMKTSEDGRLYYEYEILDKDRDKELIEHCVYESLTKRESSFVKEPSPKKISIGNQWGYLFVKNLGPKDILIGEGCGHKQPSTYLDILRQNAPTYAARKTGSLVQDVIYQLSQSGHRFVRKEKSGYRIFGCGVASDQKEIIEPVYASVKNRHHIGLHRSKKGDGQEMDDGDTSAVAGSAIASANQERRYDMAAEEKTDYEVSPLVPKRRCARTRSQPGTDTATTTMAVNPTKSTYKRSNSGLGGAMKRYRTPHEHDVLSGRGFGTNNHEGNIQFRQWVEARKNDYNLAPKNSDKAVIAREVVSLVKNQDPPGRFLQKDEAARWIELDDDHILRKTSQALREPRSKKGYGQEMDDGDTKRVSEIVRDRQMSVNYPSETPLVGEPGPKDILIGGGIGQKKPSSTYLDIIRQHAPNFSYATGKAVVQDVINELLQSGHRFIKKKTDGGYRVLGSATDQKEIIQRVYASLKSMRRHELRRSKKGEGQEMDDGDTELVSGVVRDKVMIPLVGEPGPKDILVGGGIGQKKPSSTYLDIIRQHALNFSYATRKAVVQDVIDELLQSGHRFIKKKTDGGYRVLGSATDQKEIIQRVYASLKSMHHHELRRSKKGDGQEMDDGDDTELVSGVVRDRVMIPLVGEPGPKDILVGGGRWGQELSSTYIDIIRQHVPKYAPGKAGFLVQHVIEELLQSGHRFIKKKTDGEYRILGSATDHKEICERVYASLKNMHHNGLRRSKKGDGKEMDDGDTTSAVASSAVANANKKRKYDMAAEENAKVSDIGDANSAATAAVSGNRKPSTRKVHDGAAADNASADLPGPKRLREVVFDGVMSATHPSMTSFVKELGTKDILLGLGCGKRPLTYLDIIRQNAPKYAPGKAGVLVQDVIDQLLQSGHRFVGEEKDGGYRILLGTSAADQKEICSRVYDSLKNMYHNNGLRHSKKGDGQEMDTKCLYDDVIRDRATAVNYPSEISLVGNPGPKDILIGGRKGQKLSSTYLDIIRQHAPKYAAKTAGFLVQDVIDELLQSGHRFIKKKADGGYRILGSAADEKEIFKRVYDSLKSMHYQARLRRSKKGDGQEMDDGETKRVSEIVRDRATSVNYPSETPLIGEPGPKDILIGEGSGQKQLSTYLEIIRQNATKFAPGKSGSLLQDVIEQLSQSGHRFVKKEKSGYRILGSAADQKEICRQVYASLKNMHHNGLRRSKKGDGKEIDDGDTTSSVASSAIPSTNKKRKYDMAAEENTDCKVSPLVPKRRCVGSGGPVASFNNDSI